VNVPQIPWSKDLIFSPHFLPRISCTSHICSLTFFRRGAQRLITHRYPSQELLRTHIPYSDTRRTGPWACKLPKKTLLFKVAEERSTVIGRAFTGRLSAPYGPGYAELRTHEITDGEAARGPYIANKVVVHNVRFCRDKEYIHHLRAWSIDALPVNDVAGTPSPFWEQRARLGGGSTGRIKGASIAQVIKGNK
jgi:hypothetical protein